MKLTKRIVAFVLVAVMLVSTMAVVASAATATVSMSVLASQAVTSDGKVWYAKYNTYGSQSKHTEATTTLTFNPNDGYIPMAFVKSAGWGSLLDKQYTEAVNKYGYEVAGIINGSFFDMSTTTLCGNLIVDGKVSCAHVDYADSFVAFDSDGNMDIVQSCLEFTLRFNGQEIPDGLAYLNKRQDVCGDWGNGRFFYYDTSCGSAADSKSQGYDIICEKVDNSELAVGQTLFGKVVEIKTNTYGSSFGTSGQLSNRFVLSVKNGSSYATYAQNLKVGDSVSITTTETVEASREIMEKANSVITNVGWLVKGGVDQTNIYSSIGSHSVTGTYARWTAFGKKADGTYVFFTSEGGSTGTTSRSLTLKDVAAAMIKLGCTDVIRMDGGGSSAMYVSNTGSGSPGYVQSASRSVADCILIVKKSSLVDSSLNSQLRTAINNAKANNPTAEISAIIAEAEACLAETYPVSGDVKRYLMELSPMASLERALTRADDLKISDYNAHVLNELRTYYDQGAAAYYTGNTSADVAGLANKINAVLDKKCGSTSVSVGSSYTVTNTRPSDDPYADNGVKLTDGAKGATDGGSNSAFAGFSPSAEVVIDLGAVKTTNEYNVYLAAGCWGIGVYQNNWTVDVSYSNSKNGTYTSVGSTTDATKMTGTGLNDETWSTYKMTVEADKDISARYIKIKVTNTWGGYVWMDEVEAAYKADAGIYSAPVSDYIFLTKFNQYVYGGDCILYTPDFGTITEDNANHRYTTNVLCEWDNSVNAYVVKSVTQGNGPGTVSSITLASNQIFIACHAEDTTVAGSGNNAARFKAATPGQKLAFYGIDINNKSQSCGAYLKVIDANGTDPDLDLPCEHNYTSVVTKPTCTAGGYTTYTCNNCGYSYVGDETAVVDHDYNEVVTAPTCTKQGYTTFTCKDCGDSYIGAYVAVDSNAHNPGEAATCTRAQTCLDCGATIKAKLDHDYNEVVTAPTCEDEGYTTYTCKDCSHSYVDDYVDAAGHDYASVVTEPTCTEEGYTTHTCSVCGDSYVDSTVAAHGHTPGEWVTLPNKSQEQRCDVCGELLDTKAYIPEYDYDVNGDGKFNVFDYVSVKTVVMKGTDDAELKARADVNGDGKLNIFDYVAVKSAYFAR